MPYLLKQVMYVFIVDLTEGNPDGESHVGRNVQTEAVHLGDAVHTAVRAEGGGWRRAHTHAHTYTYTQVQGDVLRIWREVRLKLH